MEINIDDSVSILPFRSPEEEEEEEEKEKGLKLHADQVIWKGFVNMSGLAKFSTCACPVSGPMDNLDEVRCGHMYRHG